MFACDAVKGMTGVDLAADFRGKYSNMVSAFRTVKDFAGGGIADLVEKIAKENGIDEINPKLAQRGDVVLIAGTYGDTLAIVGMDGKSVYAVGNDGWKRWPISTALKAWRI
jgi:hypothetical protein